jgi:vesicle-associated membrane protein-associated protein A
MAKKDQVLVIEPPSELTFTGPFTQAVSSYIKLKNPSDRKVRVELSHS